VMSKELERLRTPAADNIIDIFFRDVIGSKSDAAADGAVTTTDTLVAYIKQIVGASAGTTSLPVTIPVADAALNAYSRDVVGNKADAAAVDAVSEVESLMAYIKQAVTLAIARDTAIGVIDGYHDVAIADAATNVVMSDIVGNKSDAAAAGAVSTVESLMAYLKQSITLAIARDTAIGTAQADLDIITGASGVNLLTASQTSIDAIETDTGTTLPATLAALPQCVVKTDGAVLNGLDPLFTIAGGPVRAKIVGLVTTLVGGASNGRLQHITTTPAATVELNTGAVAIDNDAAGTFYTNIGAVSTFTPSTGLGFSLQDPVTVEETELILAPGVVQFLGSAAQDGVIAWYISFVPLSPLSTVTVAA